jgi:Protein of unknown function with PCYCGC motif
MRSEKKIIAAITLIVCLITALSACNRADGPTAKNQTQGAQGAQGSTAASKVRIPAHFTEAPPLASLGPTLSPAQFTGKVKQAYQVAKEIPQTLAQLPCFCECDRSIGHKSLHSCYEDEHAVGCGICLDSALMASNLKQQGIGDTEIRSKLVTLYGNAASGHAGHGH